MQQEDPEQSDRILGWGEELPPGNPKMQYHSVYRITDSKLFAVYSGEVHRVQCCFASESLPFVPELFC